MANHSNQGPLNEEIEHLLQAAHALPRDSVRENALYKRLRQLSVEERASIILNEMRGRGRISFDIVMRTINDRETASRVFNVALLRADASGINYVIKFGITKLGAKTTFALVRRAGPEVIEKAKYWYPQFLSSESAS